jgi:hypothetical protein
MNLTLLKLAEPDFAIADGKPDKLHCVARNVAEALVHAGGVTRQYLARQMMTAFGASDADGAWSMRDAYDALETAQVLLLGRDDGPIGQKTDPGEIFAALLRFQNSLPTQSYRSEHQVDLQQFSTPLALAWLAARAAQMNSSDLVLEPSAGTGMLAAHS